MDTMQAFAMGEANRHKTQMVFDWDEAARLIKQAGAKAASAGLAGDWEYTGGEILRDGLPLERSKTYTYLASTWAAPELQLDGGAVVECWLYRQGEDDWNADTYWPESAQQILFERSS